MYNFKEFPSMLFCRCGVRLSLLSLFFWHPGVTKATTVSLGRQLKQRFHRAGGLHGLTSGEDGIRFGRNMASKAGTARNPKLCILAESSKVKGERRGFL
jgi:hypothetical protein